MKGSEVEARAWPGKRTPPGAQGPKRPPQQHDERQQQEVAPRNDKTEDVVPHTGLAAPRSTTVPNLVSRRNGMELQSFKVRKPYTAQSTCQLQTRTNSLPHTHIHADTKTTKCQASSSASCLPHHPQQFRAQCWRIRMWTGLESGKHRSSLLSLLP